MPRPSVYAERRGKSSPEGAIMGRQKDQARAKQWLLVRAIAWQLGLVSDEETWVKRGYAIMPNTRARAAAWVRLATFSLTRMLATCRLTVCGLRTRVSAIC